MLIFIASKEETMELTKSLAAIANQLKELGADHGTISQLQQQISGLDQALDDKIKAALAGFVAPPDPQTAATIQDLTARLAAVEQGIEDLGGDLDQAPAPVTLSTSPLSLSGTVGTALTGSFSTSGGTAPYVYAVNDASAPADFSLTPEGSYSMGAAAAEAGTINLTVTDSASPANTATVPVTFSIA